MEKMESSSAALVDFTDTQIAFAVKSDKNLRETHRLFKWMNKSWLVDFGAIMGIRAVKWNLPGVESIVRNTIYRQFVGGRTLEESSATIKEMYEHNIASILDYGMEAKSDEASFQHVQDQVIKSIHFADKNKSVPVVVVKVSGLTRNVLLEKYQNGETLTDREQQEWDTMMSRLHNICQAAASKKIGVFIDAEESWIQKPIDDIAILLMREYNKEYAIVYNTYQMYRHDKLAQLKSDFILARSEDYFFGAKVVRGAYMDKERHRARLNNYPSPIQPDKASTDRDYNAAIAFCIDNYENLAFCNATHNVNSVSLMLRQIVDQDLQKNHPHLNFCQLYGMSDYITYNLAAEGFNVAKYLPYGPVNEVVPYLIRRAQENTSITGEMSRELALIDKELKRRRQEKRKNN